MADTDINDAFIPLPRSPFATQATAGKHPWQWLLGIKALYTNLHEHDAYLI